MTGKIILAGGAGLVGQNLIAELKRRNYTNLVVLDKHPTNLDIVQRLHPDVATLQVDLSAAGEWQKHLENAETVVMLQAQIGGMDYEEFERNNVGSTRLMLQTMKDYKVPYLVHISSSVVNSKADDFYTRSKIAQEKLVQESGIACIILRPTLMFGWFDRKHLGWLSRFMKKVPVFPVPGDGRFSRQPLYVRDFCAIIIRSIEQRLTGAYNITGLMRIDYIDIIRNLKRATNASALIVKIPYHLFRLLLQTWAKFDANPPFTVQQLDALVAKDDFEVIDWPKIFSVTPTPFAKAIEQTFNDPRYSNVVLEF